VTNETNAEDVLRSPFTLTLALIAEVLGVIIAAPQAAASGPIAVLQQASLAEVRPTILTPAEISEALRRGLVSGEQVESTLSRAGFSATAQGVIVGIAETLTDIGSLVALRRRGDIDQGTYAERSAMLGYSPANADLLYRLSTYVPPAQDVVQFAVREVYSPAIAERFGQFQDFPTEAMPDFERAGVTEANARKYWAAHWGLPSVQQVFEMYHRRAETNVTLDDVMLLLRSQDVMPFWREKIVQVATAPYTRVDVRRMHKLGIITAQEVENAYQALGYDDARAHNLMLFTVKANADESDDALEPFRAGLRSKTLSMYQARTMPEATARTVLVDLGYSAEQVTAYVAEAAFIRDADQADDWRAAIQKNYVQGYWNRDAVVRKMGELGFGAEEIIELVTVWDVQRELREATAEDRAQKDLTKSEVITAYRDGLLTDPEARSDLHDLGYDDDESHMLIRLADAAIAKAARAELEASLRALYIAGRIGDGDARSRLAAGGVTVARADALLLKWADEVRARTPTLTVAQVQEALKKGLIDDADADKRLTAIGYQEPDREILIAIA